MRETMSIKEARKLLGKGFKDLPDEAVESLVDGLTAVAKGFVDQKVQNPLEKPIIVLPTIYIMVPNGLRNNLHTGIDQRAGREQYQPRKPRKKL